MELCYLVFLTLELSVMCVLGSHDIFAPVLMLYILFTLADCAPQFDADTLLVWESWKRGTTTGYQTQIVSLLVGFALGCFICQLYRNYFLLVITAMLFASM